MPGTRRDSHKDLLLWRKSMDLAVAIHRVSRSLPGAEMFGLVAQLNRAAVSVPSNIAEGSARRTTKEFVAFLHVARGSLAEVETQLMLVRRVGYLEAKMILESEELINEVGRLLNAVLAGLRRRLEERSALSPIP
jgi:four helix bundle protein